MLPWDSLFLTKNGHDRYAVLDMEEYRQYEKLMAKQKLITELEKVAAPGRSRGASLRRMWKRNWESMTKVKMPMAGEITCPACLVKSYAMTTMRKRIPGQLKNALSRYFSGFKYDNGVLQQLKTNCHTALTSHGTGEQSQIPISTFHSLYICGVQRLPFHHFVGEYISVHIREGGNIALT